MSYDEIPEPGTPEYKERIEQDVRRRLLDDEVASEYARVRYGDRPSSWLPVALDEFVAGTAAELEPMWLRREDGRALLYPGCTHSIHGPSGAGKSWLSQLAIAQLLLESDAHALYVDYESYPSQIVKRLLRLGVPGTVLLERFRYHRPASAPDKLDIDANAFGHMVAREYGIAVIDGANISMMRCGLNPNSADDVAAWHDVIMLPIAERTGAAVVANDHIAKGSQDRSAIGSQHKVAGLTGAGFSVEKVEPLGRGRHGKVTVRVGDKDREGYVHELGVNDEQPDGMLVGELHVDATNPESIVAAFFSPQADTVQQVNDRRGKAARPRASGDTRPVREMELVSAYWEEKKDDPAARTGRKTEDVIRARQAERKTPVSRDRLRMAVEILTDTATEGGAYATVKPGPKNSQIHTNTRVYRADDPENRPPSLLLVKSRSKQIGGESVTPDGAAS